MRVGLGPKSRLRLRLDLGYSPMCFDHVDGSVADGVDTGVAGGIVEMFEVDVADWSGRVEDVD